MADPDRMKKDHLATYDGFLSITKTAIIAIAVILIAMALFLV